MGIGLNVDGRLEVFVTGNNGDVWHRWQQNPGAGPWSTGWAADLHGLRAASGPSVGLGRGEGGNHPGLVVFVIGEDGALWYSAQASQGWQEWQSLGGSFAPAPPATAYNAFLGLLEVFAVDREGQVRMSRETGRGGFAGLTGLATNARMTGAIGAAHASDGRTELFCAADDGTIQHNSRVTPDPANDWSGFDFLAGSISATPPAVTTCSDGRLEGVFSGLNGDIRHFWQTAPNSSFMVQGSMRGTTDAAPTLERNEDGRLELFHGERDGQVQHNWQTTANNGWSGPNNMHMDHVEGGSRLCSGRNADHRLEVFGTTPSGEVVHSWQPSPGGDPWGRESLDRPDPSGPCRLGLREADYFYA